MLSALLCSPDLLTAQRTVVENNGVSGRIETDYNGAEKIIQMRTIGADGKLEQRVVYEYLPGYFGAQQTNTTYWPSGEVRKIVRTTYDQSSNFTGEFIQVYDESGKQTGGHRLTHDPWTGVYACAEWSVVAKDYQTVDCPAGEEESGGGAEEAKTFTYEEVMKNLEAARNAARAQRKIGHMQTETRVLPPIATANREVGLVFPAELRPNQRASGTVVENPDQYDEMPEVAVTRVSIPFESAGEASRLSGWLVEVPGEKPQRADGPVTLVVPSPGGGLNIVLRQSGNPDHFVSAVINIPSRLAKKRRAPTSFQTAALCMKNDLCAVRGPFSGDSNKTFAAFDDHPATIVAETSDTAYVSIPELIAPGAHPLYIAEGSRVAAFPTIVGEFFIKNNHRELPAGQSLIVFPTLEGPGDIPDSEWRTGNYPATNLERARKLIPDFRPLKENHEGREKHEAEAKREVSEKGESKEKREAKEKKGGEILLIVKNTTPDQISLRSSKNEMLVFQLSDEAFSRGEFKYDLVVETKKAGKIEVKGYVIPLLAPVAGQEFMVKAATP